MQYQFLRSLAVAAALTLAGVGMAGAQNAGNVLVRSDGIYVRCDRCGTVQAIEHNVRQGKDHGTAGAVIGTVTGAALGHQVGKGKGRKAATVAGAVGGGFAGHAIGKGGTQQTAMVRIKLGNGSMMNVEVPDAGSIRVGDIVEVDTKGNITRIR